MPTIDKRDVHKFIRSLFPSETFQVPKEIVRELQMGRNIPQV